MGLCPPARERGRAPRREAYRATGGTMPALIEGLSAPEAKVAQTSNSKKEQFSKRGQPLPRERVALLLDRGSPYPELSTLAGLGMHDDDGRENVFGGGIICGIGYVSGVRFLVSASDSAIKGRTTTPLALKKKL